MQQVFHPDAFDDHVFYRGNIEGLIEALRKRHVDILFSMHHLSNVTIAFVGPDFARVESYAIVFQHARKPEQNEVTMTTTWCRYVDKFEKRRGDWRILRRIVVVDAIATSPVATNSLFPVPDGNRGRRDGLDPSYSV